MEVFLRWLCNASMGWLCDTVLGGQCDKGEDHMKHFWPMKPKGCLLENF